MMCLIIAVACQMCGINAILSYAVQIFGKIVDAEQALLSTYYLGLLQVVVTFLSIFIVDSYGRRTLMLIGMFIMVVSLVSTFIFSEFVPNSEMVIVFLIFLHIVGYNLSIGLVSYIYVAEIMDSMVLVTVVNYTLYILVSFCSEIMISMFGIGKVFLFFGLISLLCLIYLHKYMIESSGRSREELVAHYSSNVHLLESADQQKQKLKKSGL